MLSYWLRNQDRRISVCMVCDCFPKSFENWSCLLSERRANVRTITIIVEAVRMNWQQKGNCHYILNVFQSKLLAMPILAVMSDIRLSFSLQRHIIQIVCRYLLFTLNLCVANGAFKRTKYTHWNDAYSVLRFHFWLQIQSIPITNTQPHQTLSLTLICSFARSLAYSQQKQLKQRQQCHNLSPNVFFFSPSTCAIALCGKGLKSGAGKMRRSNRMPDKM